MDKLKVYLVTTMLASIGVAKVAMGKQVISGQEIYSRLHVKLPIESFRELVCTYDASW